MPDHDSITIDREFREGVIVVAPIGDVDMGRSPALRSALRSVQDGRPKRLVVDLGQVEYMDSSGLATLVEAMRTAKANKTEMVLCAMNDKVRAIFEIARLHYFFTIVDSLDEAAG